MAGIRKDDPATSAISGTASGVSKWGLGCGLLFITPFFIGGISALVLGIKGMQSDEKNAFIGLIVGAVFILVSCGMVVGLIHVLKRTRTVAAVQGRHPNEPWLWREDWAQGFVRSEGGSNFVFAILFTLVWNVISWGMLIAMWNEVAKSGDKKEWFIVLFPAIGFFLIWWTVYLFARNRKYGVSTFRLLANPGVLGGSLRGAVEVPTQVSPKSGFRVRLLCVHRYTTGTGDNRRTREDIQWKDEKTIQTDILKHDRTRTGIPVFFNIPYDLPPTSDSPNHIWKLIVYADVPGVDYRAEFHVPVFKTEDSDPDSTAVEDPTAAYQPDQGEFKWPEDSSITLQDSGSSIEVYVPPARNKGCLASMLVFLLIWNTIIWFMIQGKAPFVLPIIFGFIDLILLLFFFSALLYSIRFHAGPAGLRIERRFLIPVGTTVLTPDKLDRIVTDITMHFGDKRYYGVAAIPKDAFKARLASDIPNKRQAEWLARRVADCLGVEFKD